MFRSVRRGVLGPYRWWDPPAQGPGPLRASTAVLRPRPFRGDVRAVAMAGATGEGARNSGSALLIVDDAAEDVAISLNGSDDVSL